MGRLDGRVAVITGAGSGMGRATALRFLREGARVIVADVNESAGVETVALAEAAGSPGARFVKTDVADEADVEAMIATAVQSYGRLDCVLNNAGIGGAFGSVMATSVDDWDYTFAVMVRGVFLGIKHGAKAMAAAGSGGSIINVASVAGLTGGDAPIAYSAAKAAVINMTRGSAVELAAQYIRVNCICPGAIVTPMLMRGLGDDPANLVDLQPWPEPGSVDDIAGAALYLAGDDSRFVTGTMLVVDGGLTAAGARTSTRLHQRRSGAEASGGRAGVDRGSTAAPARS